MSLLLATALASATTTLPSCSWDRPGHNPFMGDVVAAVDRYSDIPAPVRAKLKARMAARQYDEIVSIGRDSIKGKARYGSQITGMHFGTGQVCATVSRAEWSSVSQERGLVYCESGHCILVPTVCRNVSRIEREDQAVAGVVADDGDPAAGNPGGAVAAAAPAAGVPAAPAAAAAPDARAAQSPASFADGAGLAPTAADAGGLGGAGNGAALGGGTATAAPAPAGSFAAVAGPGGAAAAVVGALPETPVSTSNAPAGNLPGTTVDPAVEPVASPGLPANPVDLPVPTAPVPEPGTWALMALGLGWLVRRQRFALPK